MQHQRVTSGKLADFGSRDTDDVDSALVEHRHLDIRPQLRSQGRDLRTAYAHPVFGMGVDELLHGGGFDQLTHADHHQIVGHLSHLTEEMAADQHGFTLTGEMNEHIANPANTFGVQAIGWFIQDDGMRIAQQNARKAEPLAHAQRVATDAPLRNIAESDQSEDLVNSFGADPVRDGDRPQMVAGTAPRVHVTGIQQGAHLNSGFFNERYGRPSKRAVPVFGRSSANIQRIDVLLPDPFGPKKPVTRPGCTLKLRLLTAKVAPNLFGEAADFDHQFAVFLCQASRLQERTSSDLGRVASRHDRAHQTDERIGGKRLADGVQNVVGARLHGAGQDHGNNCIAGNHGAVVRDRNHFLRQCAIDRVKRAAVDFTGGELGVDFFGAQCQYLFEFAAVDLFEVSRAQRYVCPKGL